MVFKVNTLRAMGRYIGQFVIYAKCERPIYRPTGIMSLHFISLRTLARLRAAKTPSERNICTQDCANTGAQRMRSGGRGMRSCYDYS